VLLQEEELRAKFPYLRFPTGSRGIMEMKQAGYISARKLIQGQIEAARSMAAKNSIVFDYVDEDVISVNASSSDRSMQLILGASGTEFMGSHVLVASGAFTNGPRPLLPKSRGDSTTAGAHSPDRLQLELTNRTTQVVRFSLNEADIIRLRGMPSVICKYDDFWAYMLPPILYPDGQTYLKIGAALVPEHERGHDATSTSHPGTRLLESPEELIAWYRSGGDDDATKDMTEILHNLVPGLSPLNVISDACCCPRTPTSLPYIGSVGSGHFVVIGSNGLAAKSSDEIGRLAAGAALPPHSQKKQLMPIWDEGGSVPLLASSRFAPQLRAKL